MNIGRYCFISVVFDNILTMSTKQFLQFVIQRNYSFRLSFPGVQEKFLFGCKHDLTGLNARLMFG